MSFSNLPAEIRLIIFSELLVASQPIVLLTDSHYGLPLAYVPPMSMLLFRAKKGLYSVKDRIDGDSLYPEILRVNKEIYAEASPLLYSKNRFQFPSFPWSWTLRSKEDTAHIATFIDQIRSQARLLHHMCIPFPFYKCDITLQEHITNLKLIRNSCPSVNTLELLISNIYSYEFFFASKRSRQREEALDLLNTHLRAIPSLKEIIVRIVLNVEEPGFQRVTDDATKSLRDRGWVVRLPR